MPAHGAKEFFDIGSSLRSEPMDKKKTANSDDFQSSSDWQPFLRTQTHPIGDLDCFISS